jgi:predicted phosphodiesterase
MDRRPFRKPIFLIPILIFLGSISSQATVQLPDSIVVWGPVLSMVDGRAFIVLDTNYPVMVRVIVNKQTLKPWDNAFAYHKEIQLPMDLKGRFTYQINLVGSDGTLTLGPYVARLPGETGRTLEFVVYGDTRGEDSAHYEIVRRIIASDPDFVLNTGDIVDNGNKWEDWQEFRRTTGDLLARYIYIPCLGNHDRRSPNYFNVFHLPGNEAWFEWKWGQLRLIVLDSTLPKDQQSVQTRWLEDALNVQEPYNVATIVMFHNPPLGSGKHNPWKYGLNYWIPLITASPVDMIFLGHNHHYERIEYQGKPYIVTGGGGAPLYQAGREAPETVFMKSVHHFIQVRFDGFSLQGTVIGVDGSVIETWDYPLIH